MVLNLSSHQGNKNFSNSKVLDNTHSNFKTNQTIPSISKDLRRQVLIYGGCVN